jgi:hypothetical protein
MPYSSTKGCDNVLAVSPVGELLPEIYAGVFHRELLAFAKVEDNLSLHLTPRHVVLP